MKKRLLAMLLAMLMLLSLLTACGSGEEATQAPEAAASEAAVQEEAVQEEAPEEAPAVESAAEESVVEEPAFIPSEPLTYPLADGDVSFTILHGEPALGPMSSYMPMTTYGDFETIAAGTEYIGVTPRVELPLPDDRRDPVQPDRGLRRLSGRHVRH